MSDFLDQLFHTTEVKAFSALAKEAETRYANPKAFLEEIASYLPVRLYEHHYGDAAPHSFFGLIAAEQTQALFPEKDQWRPFIQQAWFGTKETKRNPWDLGRIAARSHGSLESRWHGFETSAAVGDFQEAFAWAKGFLESDQERDFFRERSLSYALEDTALGSYKFLYLMQAWRLAGLLKWNHLEKILFAPLHFLITGPKERELSSLAKDEWRENPLPALLQNEASVPSYRYREMEQSVLFGGQRRRRVRRLERSVPFGSGCGGGPRCPPPGHLSSDLQRPSGKLDLAHASFSLWSPHAPLDGSG